MPGERATANGFYHTAGVSTSAGLRLLSTAGGRERVVPTITESGTPMTVHFDIFTLFPGMFRGPFEESILARAQAAGLIEIALHNPRDWTADRHHIVDDYPYGGGAG